MSKRKSRKLSPIVANWKTAGSAQNSITALQKADSIHCYGSEFDVWLTKDNKLVINHDPVYKMKYMEYSKGDALTGLKLSNGENLPSLEQYLETGKNCKTQIDSRTESA